MSTRRSHDVNRITGTHTLHGSPRPHPWQHIQPDIGPEPDACRLQELQWPTQISISTIGRRLVSRLGRRGPAGTGTTTPAQLLRRPPVLSLGAPGGAKRSSV